MRIIFEEQKQQDLQKKTEKADQENDKRKMEETTSTVLDGGVNGQKEQKKGRWTVKNADGTYTHADHSRGAGGGSRGSTRSFEELLVDRVFPETRGEDPTAPKIQEAAERSMLKFVREKRKTFMDIVIEAEIQDDQEELLRKIGVKTFIRIFCEKNFKSEEFKAELKEIGVSPLECHKIFGLMKEWREESMTTTPSSRSTSSVTSSISTTYSMRQEEEETNGDGEIGDF